MPFLYGLFCIEHFIMESVICDLCHQLLILNTVFPFPPVSCVSPHAFVQLNNVSLYRGYCLFMYLSVVNVWLTCFRGLIIPNNAQVNIHVQVLYWHMISILLDLGVKFLDDLIILCLTFKGLTDCFLLAPLLCIFISNAEHKFLFSLVILIF